MTNLPLINSIERNILNPLIVLLFAFALMYFIYGVLQIIRGQGSEEARTTGARHVLWGVVGMAIMVSVYGIIHVVCGTFNLRC